MPVSSSLPKSPIEVGWQLVCWTMLVGLLLFLYWDVMQGLVSDWSNNPDYSHGFLVPLLSGYFVWERWDLLKNEACRPTLFGVAVLGGGLVLLVIGVIGAELYVQRVSLLLVLAGWAVLFGGWGYLWSLMFPIGFLLFMIPLPAIVVNAIAFPLQLFAAKVAAFSLFSLGIPVLREGNLIVLPGTTLEVAEACSGLRSLLSLLALGTVYAYFSQAIPWKRWALVILSIPIAIVANASRVSGTGILAHYYGVEAAEGFYHTFEGWMMFVVAFVLLLACGMILQKIGSPPSQLQS